MGLIERRFAFKGSEAAFFFWTPFSGLPLLRLTKVREAGTCSATELVTEKSVSFDINTPYTTLFNEARIFGGNGLWGKSCPLSELRRQGHDVQSKHASSMPSQGLRRSTQHPSLASPLDRPSPK